MQQKIYDVIANRMLTAELRAEQAPCAKVLPQEAYCRRLLPTQPAGVVTELFWGTHNKKLYGQVVELMAEKKRQSRIQS